MAWGGQFVFGDAFAAYFGPSDDNDLHEHAAYQIVLSAEADAIVIDETGDQHTGRGFLIRPMIPHAVQCDSDIALIYLDPQSGIALDLANRLDPDDIAALDLEDMPFRVPPNSDDLFAQLNDLSVSTPSNLDARLEAVLAELRDEPGRWSITEAAARVGLSESRLRVLARKQFGVPLSTWLVWRKLECSAKALAAGASLAEAAFAGGFSDQAHFTRAMRRMFGITPSVASRSLTGRS